MAHLGFGSAMEADLASSSIFSPEDDCFAQKPRTLKNWREFTEYAHIPWRLIDRDAMVRYKVLYLALHRLITPTGVSHWLNAPASLTG